MMGVASVTINGVELVFSLLGRDVHIRYSGWTQCARPAVARLRFSPLRSRGVGNAGVPWIRPTSGSGSDR